MKVEVQTTIFLETWMRALIRRVHNRRQGVQDIQLISANAQFSTCEIAATFPFVPSVRILPLVSLAMGSFVLLCSSLLLATLSQTKTHPFDLYARGGDALPAILNSALIPPEPSCYRPSSPASIGDISSRLAPALFVIGDSSVDCGNNNFLGTFARADRLPYGRDFDTHQPTGRFCNGRIAVDYIALRLGLPFVPSYLGQTGNVEDMIHGVNYASAGAGIIFSSGSELGQHVSLTQQIQQVSDTFEQFIMAFGEDAATNYISKSILYISIGVNDYIHYYLLNVSAVQTLYLPWSFNHFLANTVNQELKNLYNAKVRNVVLMGLAPIGCAPYYLWEYGSRKGECVQKINNMMMEFNFAMRYLVEELRHSLPDLNIIFCDVFQGSMDIIQNHEHYGFTVRTDACCGAGKYKGLLMCLSPEMACINASSHIWWDQFHPTDAVNQILADNIWSSLHTTMCYPMNLKEMFANSR